MDTEPQTLLVLHECLRQGDRLASEVLISVLLEPLVREMERKFPRTDPHQVCDGVTDALLDVCSRPGTFDPGRSVPLDRFIAQAAWRNIRDTLRGEKRRKVREEKASDLSVENLVALPPPAANSEESLSQRWRQQTDDLMRTLDNPMDRKILELKLAGVRRTDEFAQVIGITHLPIAEQRRAVKRAKDRIDVQLKRKAKGPS